MWDSLCLFCLECLCPFVYLGCSGNGAEVSHFSSDILLRRANLGLWIVLVCTSRYIIAPILVVINLIQGWLLDVAVCPSDLLSLCVNGSTQINVEDNSLFRQWNAFISGFSLLLQNTQWLSVCFVRAGVFDYR